MACRVVSRPGGGDTPRKSAPGASPALPPLAFAEVLEGMESWLRKFFRIRGLSGTDGRQLAGYGCPEDEFVTLEKALAAAISLPNRRGVDIFDFWASSRSFAACFFFYAAELHRRLSMKVRWEPVMERLGARKKLWRSLSMKAVCPCPRREVPRGGRGKRS